MLTVRVAAAQSVHERSAPVAGARYEVIQSTLVVRSTYLLDRYNGAVRQLVLRADSTLAWDAVPRNPHPMGDPQRTGQANYEMFLSGIANRFSLLINVNNGATWQVVQASDGSFALDPIS